MKISIDFSIFTLADGSFGSVTGEIETLIAPQIGDSISFLFPQSDQTIDSSIGFSGVLKVTDRIMAANQESQPLIVALSDVTLAKRTDALKLTDYLESAFGLFPLIYSEQTTME